MRYKKIMILTIFLVSLLTVSAVNAADNTTSDITSAEETTDEVVSIEENGVILKENNAGTFTDLASEIANVDNEWNLTRNYTYCDDDSDYKDGITIDKSIVINGNGFTINGNNQAKIFNIHAVNVTLDGMNFLNSNSSGSAIYWSGNNGVLFNCNFVNSSFYAFSTLSSANGGSVY